MKFNDLITPIDTQSDEELRERLRVIKHNRERARPVAMKAAERVEKKAVQKRASGIDKMLDTLSDSDREALIERLKQL